MREIKFGQIKNAVKELCIKANTEIASDVISSLKKALKTERSPLGKEILGQIMLNDEIAKKEKVPACQDTGVAVIFVELGQEVKITGGDLEKAINEGVRQGYKEGYLRKSIVAGPFDRKNTGDNTPAIIHTQIVPGNKLKLKFMAKGAGSENCSAAKVLKPSEGMEGVKKFVLEKVLEAGPNPCPPIIVGVGVGGTLEHAALLAKKALMRKVGKNNSKKDMAKLEKELLSEINKTGIGPGGLGGTTTALAVNIETYPCHIASLPVAVNINCHAHRVREAVL